MSNSTADSSEDYPKTISTPNTIKYHTDKGEDGLSDRGAEEGSSTSTTKEKKTIRDPPKVSCPHNTPTRSQLSCFPERHSCSALKNTPSIKLVFSDGIAIPTMKELLVNCSEVFQHAVEVCTTSPVWIQVPEDSFTMGRTVQTVEELAFRGYSEMLELGTPWDQKDDVLDVIRAAHRYKLMSVLNHTDLLWSRAL